MEATILITTKDRRDVLREALLSVERQEGDLEILVIDDGSTDGTSQMVHEEFPWVRCSSSPTSHGLICQRNRGILEASSEIVICIDDDVLMVDERTALTTIRDFTDDRIAVVGIPFVDFSGKGISDQQFPPSPNGTWITNTFFGGACAVRRSVFIREGGYDETLERQGEEFDLSLRLLDKKFLVRLGTSAAMEHREAPRPSSSRNIRLGARNDMVRALRLVPIPFLPGRVAKAVYLWSRIGLRERALLAVTTGIAQGVGFSLRNWRHRRPVAISTYQVDRKLRHRGPLPLEEIPA